MSTRFGRRWLALTLLAVGPAPSPGGSGGVPAAPERVALVRTPCEAGTERAWVVDGRPPPARALSDTGESGFAWEAELLRAASAHPGAAWALSEALNPELQYACQYATGVAIVTAGANATVETRHDLPHSRIEFAVDRMIAGRPMASVAVLWPGGVVRHESGARSIITETGSMAFPLPGTRMALAWAPGSPECRVVAHVVLDPWAIAGVGQETSGGAPAPALPLPPTEQLAEAFAELCRARAAEPPQSVID